MREKKVIDGKLVCSRCHENKPVEMFSKSNNKSGYKSYCKECAALEYQQKREHYREVGNLYYQNNKDKWREYGKKRRTEHKDEVSEYMHNYYVTHSDEIRERTHLAYLNITEEGIEKRRQYTHKKRVNKHYKQIRSDATKRRTVRKNAVVSDLTEKEWGRTLALFGGRCAYCGADGKITRDHIIPLIKGGGYTATNIIPCCTSCNSRKHDKDMELWYLGRDCFDFDRFIKIELVKGGAFK